MYMSIFGKFRIAKKYRKKRKGGKRKINIKKGYMY